MTPAAFIAAARSYLGTPWRHMGRNRAGLDCIGLVLVAARDAGLSLPDPAPYEREPADARLVLEASRLASRVSSPAPGDVMVFRTTRHVGHVGIRQHLLRSGQVLLTLQIARPPSRHRRHLGVLARELHELPHVGHHIRLGQQKIQLGQAVGMALELVAQ